MTMPMSVPGRRGADRRGFTLVEVLVAIAIIAVIVAILLPTMGKVRSFAQSTNCLSNLHQIALGWIMYTNDHTTFPHGGPDHPSLASTDFSVPLMHDWGGVDWYDNDSQVPFNKQRPLNPYIGSETERIENRAATFRCPSDTGMVYANGAYFSNDAWEEESSSDEASTTVFGVRGTSYRANDWLWAKIGRATGWYISFPNQPDFQISNRPEWVVNPQHFVLVGDAGSMYSGRWTREARDGDGTQAIVPRGWWHGYEMSNLAFLDGSSRHVQMTPGTATTKDYHFYFDPVAHEPWSWVTALNSLGAPDPPPGPTEERDG